MALKYLKLIAALSLLTLSLDMRAEETTCTGEYWTTKGNILKTVKLYDDMLLTLEKLEPQVQAQKLNEFKNKYGLPLSVSATEQVKYQGDYLMGEVGPAGAEAGLFLKQISLTKIQKKDFGTDAIYELEKIDSKKSIKEWPIPYNSNGPIAIQETSIYYAEEFQALCKEMPKPISVVLKIMTNGDYQVEAAPPSTTKTEVSCPNFVTFKGSGYATCQEFVDAKTKKKRIIAWESPMT
jgi:hypothetical protein